MLTSNMRTIEFYRSSSGRCPIEEFLDSLTDDHARKVAWTLRLVERLDRVPQQYLKKLLGTDDLWEIRIQTSGRSYRLLGFFDGPLLMIRTSGFAKKQQKIPVRELDLARQRRTDYLQRRKTP
jgi:phage-related protein